MDTIHINNDKELIEGYNFSPAEFFNPVKTPVGLEFELYTCLLDAMQVLRDWFTDFFGREFKWLITSVFRPNDPLTLPPAHRVEPPAVDSVCEETDKWEEVLNMIREELKHWQTSDLVKKIVDTGTNVIIIENGCLHCHHRTDNLHHTLELGDVYIGEWGIDKDGKQFDIAYSFNTVK